MTALPADRRRGERAGADEGRGRPLRLVWTHLRRHPLQAGAALGWRILFVLLPMQLPILTGALVDGLGGQRATVYGLALVPAAPAEALRWIALALVAFALLYGIGAYAHTVARAQLSRGFVTWLRREVVDRMTLLSLEQHSARGVGDLLSCAVSDAGAMRSFLDRVFVQTTTNALRVIYPTAMLLAISPQLAAVALAALPPQLLLTRWLQQRLHLASRRTRRAEAALTQTVQETLDGFETLLSLGAGEVAAERAHDDAERLERAQLGSHRISAGIHAVVWLTTSLGLAATWWWGGRMALAGELTLGTLVAAVAFVTLVYQPFRRYTSIASTYKRGLASLERIDALLTETPAVAEAPGARPLRVDEGHIELRDVAFGYRGDGADSGGPALTLPELTLPARRVSALVGPSGAGKSTLLKLLARLHDPQRGEVRIDGQPLRACTLASLRDAVAYVPQRPRLFSGTLRDNLRLVRPEASDAELRRACELAAAWRFVAALPDGLDTRVGAGGRQLSGGEAHRVAVARALLRRPRILLLDEPTAALDAESERALLDSLTQLRGGTTVVVAAHRAGTVAAADRAVLLDGGRVTAQGPPADLRAASARYRELFPERGRRRAA